MDLSFEFLETQSCQTTFSQMIEQLYSNESSKLDAGCQINYWTETTHL